MKTKRKSGKENLEQYLKKAKEEIDLTEYAEGYPPLGESDFDEIEKK